MFVRVCLCACVCVATAAALEALEEDDEFEEFAEDGERAVLCEEVCECVRVCAQRRF